MARDFNKKNDTDFLPTLLRMMRESKFPNSPVAQMVLPSTPQMMK